MLKRGLVCLFLAAVVSAVGTLWTQIRIAPRPPEWRFPPVVRYEPVWKMIPELARADELIRRYGRPEKMREEIILVTWEESRMIWNHRKTRPLFTHAAGPFNLLLSQQGAESCFNPFATSRRNPDGSRDLGISQQNSRYLKARGITDWRDVRQNVHAQALFMCSLLQDSARWEGDKAIRAALAGYTAGPRWARRGIVPDIGRTRAHVARIMKLFRELEPAYPAGMVYHVQRGDTLSAIARRFRTTVPQLATANHIQNVNLIFPGQQLMIPEGGQ